MPRNSRPDPNNVSIEEQGVRSVNPRTDVMPSTNPWAGKYSALIDLPSPYDISAAPWDLDERLRWMMLRDPQVFAGYMLWKTGILVDGVQVYPSTAVKKGEKRFALAREIAEFNLWSFNNMRGSFHSKMLQLLDCCVLGQKAAVQVFRIQESGRWKNKLVIDYLRVMPNNTYRIKVDQFGVVKGLQASNAQGDDDIYGIRKFIHMVFRPYDDHPGGTNMLWPAYGAWYEKQQIAPERLANMTQFGSPSLWANAPEGVKDIELLDQYGQPVVVDGRIIKVPINEHMMQALSNFQGNGSAMVFPYGSDLHKLEASNGSDLFWKYSDDKNLEIMKSMFFTTQWTEQQKYGSNASSKTGEGVGHFTLMDGKNALSDALEESVCYNLTTLNYGMENADLVPRVSFGSTARSMVSSLANSIAALYSVGFFDQSQREAICQVLGLPEPSADQEPINPQGEPTGNVLVNNKKDNDDSNSDEEE